MTRLQNKRILLTRPKRQSAPLQQELERRNAVVYLAPLIRTEPVNREGAKQAISRLEEFHWLVFTSSNGVEYFQQHFREVGARMPEHLQVAAIGPTTAASARRCNLKVSLVPTEANSEGLVEAFEQLDLTGKKFGLFLAEKTRDILPGALSRMGADVIQIPLYRTMLDLDGIRALKTLPWNQMDAVVLMSASAAEVLAANCPVEAAHSPAKYCAVGSVTERRMKELGLPVHLVAAEASVGGIVQMLESGL